MTEATQAGREASPTTGSSFLPLDPAAFSFRGFDDLRDEIARKVGNVGIRRGEPRVTVVDDAVFVPTDRRRVAGQGKSYGGLLTADGRPVDTAQIRRKGGTPVRGIVDPVDVTPEHEVDEEAVYLGPLFNHYGRVLLESLARVWFLKEIDPSVRVVFDYPNAGKEGFGSWVAIVLAAFGIPEERMLPIDGPTRLRRASVPEALFEQLRSGHERFMPPYREVATRFAGDERPSRQPLYLSRRLLTSGQRVLVGEEELEDLLRENGFAVAYPETMSFEDQVRLINRHTDILSGVGSAAHTILFARHRPALHFLTSGELISANYFLCSALADVPTTFVNCLGTGGRPALNEERRARQLRRPEGDRDAEATGGGGAQATPQLVDIPSVVAYLDERGLLKKRLRASLAGRDPALRRRYDEAWLYARLRKTPSTGEASLPVAIEREALALAAHSWPLSLMLTRYYVGSGQVAERADGMARQFVDLVAAEWNMNRLAHYRPDVESTMARGARVFRPETAERIAEVLEDRFALERTQRRGRRDRTAPPPV